jgi:hypothetical protein
MTTSPTTSNLINSATFNDRITLEQKRQFYKDLGYIDNGHDFCSDRSDICKTSRKDEFERISGKGNVTNEITRISHSKCEDEDEIFKAMLSSIMYKGGISDHIKNLIYEQTMNSLDLPNGPTDKKAWENSLASEDQPVHVHVVFSKLSIDGKTVFTKDTRSLIMSIFANSINDFGMITTNQDTFSANTLKQLAQSKVYSIDASCVNFVELLNVNDFTTTEAKRTKFVHLNDGASKFDSATKLMPDESMKTITLPLNGNVQLISANISPLIIKRTTANDIKWIPLFNRFSYCLINIDSAGIYPFTWVTDTSILNKYQTYMLVDPACFMYSVSVQTNTGIFLPGETQGYTLILREDKGILIKTDGKEIDGKDSNKVVGIGSISVATLSRIYSYTKDSKDAYLKAAYDKFNSIIIHLLGTSSIESVQKILLDFKRCGDQLAVMSLKQLNDLSKNKVAFVSLDRLAYMYSKVVGVCTSIRVGVAGAYFEEPDGDEKQPDSIDYINESGHNYNLWFHRTESLKELSQEDIFKRTIDISKNVLGETAQYIIERFGENRQTRLNILLRKFKDFTDASFIYIKGSNDQTSIFTIVYNLIVLFTLIINLNVYYISLLLSKIDELSSYLKIEHTFSEQVVFKSKLELLEELNKKLKKAYIELPNNLVEKLISNLNKYSNDTKNGVNSTYYTYRSFEIYLASMNENLKGDSMEANYGILLNKIINDHDKKLPSLKDYVLTEATEDLPRHRKGIERKPQEICKAVLNSIKIIATSIYGVVFKNIDKILSVDESIVLRKIEFIKKLLDTSINSNNTQFITNLNILIEKIISDITLTLNSNHIDININLTPCAAKYENNYSSPKTVSTKIVNIVIPANKLVIPLDENIIDISNIITLFVDKRKINSIIDDMNSFVSTYGNSFRTIPPSIKELADSLGTNMIRLNALNRDWTINIENFEKSQCKDDTKGGLCNLTTLQMIEAFDDGEYLSKVDEFINAGVNLTKNTAIKTNLITFAIINKLLKISGNKNITASPIRTAQEQSGGGGVGNGPTDKFTFDSKYILNSEYVLSLSFAKKYFREFRWEYRLKLALQFLDSTMRFYETSYFINTVHLMNITRKYCNYLLDTYDLLSFEPLHTILDRSINPAIAQILQLYLTEIYLPSFHTVRKIAVSLFLNDIVNTLNSIESPSNIHNSSSSRRFLRSSSNRQSSMRSIRKRNSSSSSSSSSSRSRKSASFGRSKGMVSLRRTISAPNLKYRNSGLLPSFELSSLNIIEATHSIQDSIETRIDIINKTDEYDLEKLYINFTTDVYTCGEISTVYFDEEFYKIPEYKEMFQTSYTTQIKTQTIIQAPSNVYYSLIPFLSEPDENQSFIKKKSIDFENVYNLINLFKLFKYNPLNIEGYSTDINTENPLEMFNLGNIYMMTKLGHLIGSDISLKDALEKTASFVYNVQSMVIQHYEPTQNASNEFKLADDTRQMITGLSGGSSLSASKKSSYRRSRTSNRFVLITHTLKLFVITVEIYNETSTSSKIIQPDETHLSQIEFENTIEIEDCLLRLTDVFDGMIHNDTIPPYMLDATEIYDFN